MWVCHSRSWELAGRAGKVSGSIRRKVPERCGSGFSGGGEVLISCI